jgi:hypothetical protein
MWGSFDSRALCQCHHAPALRALQEQLRVSFRAHPLRAGHQRECLFPIARATRGLTAGSLKRKIQTNV